MAKVLGHIDCPTCGTVKGMRVTLDKNGDPFGYCEANCSQQMRVGGDRRRVAMFRERYPWAVEEAPAPPVTVTEGEGAKVGPVTAAPAPAPAPAAQKNDWKALMGVGG